MSGGWGETWKGLTKKEKGCFGLIKLEADVMMFSE
jgi:hypothetical protein